MLSGRTNINNRFARNYMNGGDKKRGKILCKEPCPFGWMMGFEPTTLRTTI